MPDLFAPDSVIRRISPEPAILLGAGRALLLQLAHPSVAQGVADHSDFQRNPFRRLQGTLEATNAVVFGSEELATDVGRRISWIHNHVVGPTYRANDPDNLLWVHATLMDTALDCYLDLVGPLSGAEQEQYYEEMTRVAEIFGCPRTRQPATLAEFRSYFDDAMSTMQVTDVGRRLAADIVSPRFPGRLEVPLSPALGVHRLTAIGTLPPLLRERFGFTWGPAQQRRLERFQAAARTIFRVTPRAVRVAPIQAYGRVLLRQASRHIYEFDTARSLA